MANLVAPLLIVGLALIRENEMRRSTNKRPNLTDKEIIIIFVDYLAQNGNFGLIVDAWPDETNRQSSDIDAIAGPFAIEHSSVDTVPNQRRDSAWFLEVVGGLEDDLGQKLPFRLSLTFPYEGVQCGQSWFNIRSALREWILNESKKLTLGKNQIIHALGIPFEFYAKKSEKDCPGLLFFRLSPDTKELSNRLKKQLDRKASKLFRYKAEGKITIIIVESDDIALMDDSIIQEALIEAYPNSLPVGVDQVWFADTSIPQKIIFTEMTSFLVR